MHGAYIRWCHLGRVCSGDYIYGTEALNKEPPYQWQSGQFMQIYIGLMCGLCLIVILCSCVGQAFEQMYGLAESVQGAQRKQKEKRKPRYDSEIEDFESKPISLGKKFQDSEANDYSIA